MSVSEANPKGNLTLTLLLRSYVHFYTTSGVLPVRAISHWRELFTWTVRANAYSHWCEWSGSASKHTDVIFDVYYRFI